MATASLAHIQAVAITTDPVNVYVFVCLCVCVCTNGRWPLGEAHPGPQTLTHPAEQTMLRYLQI